MVLLTKVRPLLWSLTRAGSHCIHLKFQLSYVRTIVITINLLKMAYSEFLADRIRQRLKSVGIVEEKKMMGGLIFMVNDLMCIGIDIDKTSSSDRLMVRVGKLPYKDLLSKKGSRKMDFTGKEMRGFLFIDPDGFDNDEDLDFWVEKALDFNQHLSNQQQ